MPLSHLTLRLKSRPANPDAPKDPLGGPADALESEVLLDGKKLTGVSKVVLGLSAETLVPVVFLELIPGQIDVEVSAPAVVKAGMAEPLDGSAKELDW